jgi:Macrocin-O-methyltransferase (TylF)
MSDRWTPYTILGGHEIDHLREMLRLAVPGPVFVAGTFRGGDVMAMMDVSPDRRFVVVDSFRGVGDPIEAIDGSRHPRGDFNVGGVEAYLGCFDRAGYPRPEVFEMYIDPDSIRSIPALAYALAWLDLDHYEPTYACIRHLWPQLAPGGVIATHDHGNANCPGIARACLGSGLSWTVDPETSIAFSIRD